MKKVSKFLLVIPQFVWTVLWARGLAMILWAALGFIALVVVIGFPIMNVVKMSPEEIAERNAKYEAVDLSKCKVYGEIDVIAEDENFVNYKVKCKKD